MKFLIQESKIMNHLFLLRSLGDNLAIDDDQRQLRANKEDILVVAENATVLFIVSESATAN
jgi:hypothetical protein